MNMKVGIGFFMFCGVAVLWALWAWQSDPDRAGRMLIIAIGATAIALFLMTSKRMTAWFKEAEKKLEIDEYRERQAQRGQEIRAALTRSASSQSTRDTIELLEKLADLHEAGCSPRWSSRPPSSRPSA